MTKLDFRVIEVTLTNKNTIWVE